MSKEIKSKLKSPCGSCCKTSLIKVNSRALKASIKIGIIKGIKQKTKGKNHLFQGMIFRIITLRERKIEKDRGRERKTDRKDRDCENERERERERRKKENTQKET